jgi:hypothetical protein
MADPPPGRPPGTPGASAAHVQLATDEDPSEWAYSNEYSDGEGANDQPITVASLLHANHNICTFLMNSRDHSMAPA